MLQYKFNDNKMIIRTSKILMIRILITYKVKVKVISNENS